MTLRCRWTRGFDRPHPEETAAQHERYLDVVADSHQQFLDMSTRMLAEIVGDPASATM